MLLYLTFNSDWPNFLFLSFTNANEMHEHLQTYESGLQQIALSLVIVAMVLWSLYSSRGHSLNNSLILFIEVSYNLHFIYRLYMSQGWQHVGLEDLQYMYQTQARRPNLARNVIIIDPRDHIKCALELARSLYYTFYFKLNFSCVCKTNI